MALLHRVASKENPHYKGVRDLLHPSGVNRTHTLLVGSKLLEAWWEARDTLAGSRFRPEQWLRLEDAAGHPLESRIDRPVLLLPVARLKELTDTHTPPDHALLMSLAPEPAGALGPRAIGPWGIQDPGNLGAILRAAAAFGFQDAILGPGCADPFAPKALRGAMGAAFHLRIRRCESVPLDEGHWFALDGVPGAVPLSKADLHTPVRILVGNEGHGWDGVDLPAEVQRLAIPIGAVESLNAAVAAGIACHEVARRG